MTRGETDLTPDPAPVDRYELEPRVTGITPFRVLFPIGVIFFVGFWTWALFFADKEAVNKIDDREWAARAEAICAPVKQEIRELDLLASDDLDVRAELVTESTDLLDRMIDDVTAVEPSDPKGRDIVPRWVADYRALIAQRYDYADDLRNGIVRQFSEPARNGIPVTEPLETFAGDNEMPSCAPPRRGVL